MGDQVESGLANQVNQALAHPSGGWIMESHFDLFHHTIMLSVYMVSQHKHFRIVFSEVVSFYYTRGYGDYRFEDTGHEFAPGFWAISEWTSAGYYPDGVGTVSVEAEPSSYESKWVGRYSTQPNFAIEQLVGMLLIAAGRVQVDDQLFQVGFPKPRPTGDEHDKRG